MGQTAILPYRRMSGPLGLSIKVYSDIEQIQDCSQRFTLYSQTDVFRWTSSWLI